MIQDCIQQSVELMTKKFVKFIKASQSKTKVACQNLVDQSMFPHSHQQIDTYLRRYADKPELARVRKNAFLHSFLNLLRSLSLGFYHGFDQQTYNQYLY